MKTALVTGSKGFVGTHLCRLLRSHNINVTGYDMRDGHDVRDYERLRSVIAHTDPDYIFHLAAQAYVPESTTDVRRAMDVNMTGTVNLLEAVRQTGSQARILITGTSEEYGYETQPDGVRVTEESCCRPTTPYGLTKLGASSMGLVYHQLYGLQVVVTRAWNHTGPGHSSMYALPAFARRIAEYERDLRPYVEHGSLDSVRNYTSVHDIIEAYLLAINLEPGVYNLCSEYTVSLSTVMQMLCDMASKQVELKEIAHLHRGPAKFYPLPSAKKFQSLTGWEPKVNLSTMLEELLNYWRERVAL